MSITSTTITTTTQSTILSPINDQQYAAVHIPEIVSHIISYLASYEGFDPLKDKSNGSSIIRRNTKYLFQCLLINHLWYECSVRHLWRHVVFEQTEAARFYQFADIFANKQITNPIPPPPPFLPTSYSSSTIPLTSPPDSSLSPLPVPEKTKKETPIPSLSTPQSILVPTHQKQSTLPSSKSTELRHKDLRSLTLRHIKKGHHTTLSIAAIAKYASHLQRLDFYISNYVTDEAVTPFFTHTNHCLTHVSLAGCPRVSDTAILALARHAPDLAHLDLRACGLISDISISAIATCCPRIRYLNVGRVHNHDPNRRRLITNQSIALIAQHTQVAVLGLAGCDIEDQSILALANHCAHTLERVSANQCHRLTNVAIQVLLSNCPNVTVFEMMGCPLINDWCTIEALVDRKVALAMNVQQKMEFQRWSRCHGKGKIIKEPVKQ